MDIKMLKNQFIEIYGKSDESVHVFFAPGRVNLIGEHTDYNGGFVFPCALSLGTWLVARKIHDNKISFHSINEPYSITLSNNDWTTKQGNYWVNYPLGVINEFIDKGLTPGGMQLLFAGNLPAGAGLSSSASVEMVTAVMLNNFYTFNVDMVGLVKIAKWAENHFVGVNCGIMDQFASGMGKEGQAIFLDCNTLEYKYAPVKLEHHSLIISNTNKPRALADSKYNERRAECEKAVEIISNVTRIKNLGQIPYGEWKKYEQIIPDETIKRRARHVVTEIERTRKAVDALAENDIKQFGQLMNASHDSLRDDYEVTGKELDTLVEEARKIEGTVGSRMTGAGFGGCTISIVENSSVEKFKQQVGANYKAKTGLTPDFYIAQIGEGARQIE